MTAPSPSPRLRFVLCAALAFLLPLLLFLPSVRYALIDLDDIGFILHNNLVLHGLSFSSIRDAFVAESPAPMYIPLLWISYMLDVSLFGVHPWAFHLTNVLLHAANSLLLFLLLRHLFRRFAFPSSTTTRRSPPGTSANHTSLLPPLLLTLLWALHPLRVESVAWATERKDCLAVFFCLLTILSWLPAIAPRSSFRRRGTFAGLSFAVFALGLLSKPSLAPLPLVLAFLALPPFRPRPRLWLWALALLPFFAASAFASHATTALHDIHNNVIPPPLFSRLATVPSVIFFYVSKLLLPIHLAVVYPQWSSPLWLGFLLALPLVVFAVWIIHAGRSSPLLWLGTLFAAVFFLPASGIVPIPYTLVADRYTCLPAIGLSIALLPLFSSPRKHLLAVVFALLAAACAAATAFHLPTWKNSASVFLPVRRLLPDQHSVRLYDARMARWHGDFLVSHRCIQRGLAFYPDESLLLVDIPNVIALDAPEAALRVLKDIRPRQVLLPLWTFHVATVQLMLAQHENALATVERTLPALPPGTPLRNTLLQIAAIAAYHADRPELALRYGRLSGLVAPDAPSVVPECFLPFYIFLWDNDGKPEALRYFRKLLESNSSPQTLNNIAWILSTDFYSPAPPSEAVDLARRALDAIPPGHPFRPSLMDTLAAALANAGEFDDAASTLSEALSALPPDAPSRSAMQYRLSLYRRRLPFRESPNGPVPLDEYDYDPHL